MVHSAGPGGTLGSLVHAYVAEQCQVILEARFAVASRDEGVVHPVRVAIRRLRATLRTFGDVYDPDHGASLAKELQWAGLLLGDVRDLQVLAERFTEPDAATAAPAEQVIADEIQRDRVKAWDAVTVGLNSPRGAALYAEIARWKDDPPLSGKAARPAARVRKRVQKADARLRRRLDRARAASTAGEATVMGILHDARKAAKRHRYAVELASPVLGAHADEMITRGKALQDALGEHQDAVVALAFLQQIDVDPQQPEAVTALAELIARTREDVFDIAGVLGEADRIRG
ncbi:MAG: CHAD domain-containing protein [Microbacterium sp.]